MQLFIFSSLFPGHFCSVYQRVVRIVSGDCNQSSELANRLPPSFLGTCTVFSSSLACKDLCMAINFLVHWPICLSSSLVHFKNGSEYFTTRTAQVFISLIRFLLNDLISSCFFLRYSFFFAFIATC